MLAYAKTLMPRLVGVKLRFIPNRSEPVAITYQFGEHEWSELYMEGGTLPSWWSGTAGCGFDHDTLEAHWKVRDWWLRDRKTLKANI